MADWTWGPAVDGGLVVVDADESSHGRCPVYGAKDFVSFVEVREPSSSLL